VVDRTGSDSYPEVSFGIRCVTSTGYATILFVDNSNHHDIHAEKSEKTIYYSEIKKWDILADADTGDKTGIIYVLFISMT
jgi:hypothetical protein